MEALLKSNFLQRALVCNKRIESHTATLLDRGTVLAALAALRVATRYQGVLTAWHLFSAKLATKHPVLYLRAKTALIKVETSHVKLKCWLLEAFIHMVTALRGY
jgi:hypothetical protein